MEIFELLYLIGFTVATVIRSYYGLQFKRKEIVQSQKETPVVFVGMARWGGVGCSADATFYYDFYRCAGNG